MRKSYGALFGSLVAGIFILIRCAGTAGTASTNQCPCGFVFSQPGNGCVVDIWGLNPCQPGGGPSGGSNTGGNTGNTGGGVAPPAVGTGCPLVVSPCDFSADFREGTFSLWFFDGGPVAGKNVRVRIIAREHSSGKACIEIGGVVPFPSGTKTMSIPVDASTAMATYPSLRGTSLDNCVGNEYTINVSPEGSPDCGCTAHAKKL